MAYDLHVVPEALNFDKTVFRTQQDPSSTKQDGQDVGGGGERRKARERKRREKRED